MKNPNALTLQGIFAYIEKNISMGHIFSKKESPWWERCLQLTISFKYFSAQKVTYIAVLKEFSCDLIENCKE